MKKGLVLTACAVLMLSSCDTYTGAGAYMGGGIGAILGSAIGGISNGRYGSDVGTLIGMAGGAAVGAAIGAEADRRAYEGENEYYGRAQSRRAQRDGSGINRRGSSVQGQVEDSGFDVSNSGDDRLFGIEEELSGGYSNTNIVMPRLEITNVQFADVGKNGRLEKNEIGKISFEIRNHSNFPIYDIMPKVVESSGNKHVYISQGILVESIPAHSGIRYTAQILTDRRIKTGSLTFQLSVVQNLTVICQTEDLKVPTN